MKIKPTTTALALALLSVSWPFGDGAAGEGEEKASQQEEVGLETIDVRATVRRAELQSTGAALVLENSDITNHIYTTPLDLATQAPGATIVQYGESGITPELKMRGFSDAAMLTKATGQELEIVPQLNPARVPVGGKLPVQILFPGKPLPGAEVKAYFTGFSEEGAFAGRADQEDKINIIPLKGGEWLAKTT